MKKELIEKVITLVDLFILFFVSSVILYAVLVVTFDMASEFDGYQSNPVNTNVVDY